MTEPLPHRVICEMSLVEFNPVTEQRCLIKPVIDWFIDQRSIEEIGSTKYITWAMNEIKEEVYLSFADAELAMMFKLAWGGR